jgi:Uma2 family endonuclease
MATARIPLTAESVLSMPDDDGVVYELIRGGLREYPKSRHNRGHSRANSRVAHLFEMWLDTQPEPRGEIVCGEAGFIIAHDPDSGVGIDVAYVSAKLSAATPEERTFFDGAPLLAVEILSPYDKQQEIDEKVELYLESRVEVVWVMNPRFRTVTVYRQGAGPVLFNAAQEITAEPVMPRFRAQVADLFGRSK